jgi:glycerophosphoryl diester phosphodiesterase
VGNPWLRRRVIAYAHRGGAREAPSNTLYAMRRALARGATGLELDVHPTADGHLVVCHDPTVDRTTDGSGPISSLTLEQVRSLDAAYWFCPGEEAVRGRDPKDYPLRGLAGRDPSLRLPTLEEVLQAFPGVVLNIDIKQGPPATRAYEAEVAAALARFGRGDDVIVTSFNDATVRAFSELAPHVPTAAGLGETAEFVAAVRSGAPPPALARQALQLPPTWAGADLVDRALVEAAHRAGLAVHVWTVDDPGEMARLVSLGVDGIMSDVPSVLARVLAELGAAWRPGEGPQPRPALGRLP